MAARGKDLCFKIPIQNPTLYHLTDLHILHWISMVAVIRTVAGLRMVEMTPACLAHSLLRHN